MTLVPGSLLPYKKQYQAIAKRLPDGYILVCLPAEQTASYKALMAVAHDLVAKGRDVALLPPEHFRMALEILRRLQVR